MTRRPPTKKALNPHGFYIDVTPSEQERQQEVTAAVAQIAENRAAIDQANGMLMLAYGIDAQAAFDLLRWRSQQTNAKLRFLAEQLIADLWLPAATTLCHPGRRTTTTCC